MKKFLFMLILFTCSLVNAQTGAKIKWNTVADLTASNAKPSAFFRDSTAIVLRLSVDSISQPGTSVYLFQVYRFSDTTTYKTMVEQLLQSAKQQQIQAQTIQAQILRQRKEQKDIEDDADAEIRKRTSAATQSATRQFIQEPPTPTPKPTTKATKKN